MQESWQLRALASALEDLLGKTNKEEMMVMMMRKMSWSTVSFPKWKKCLENLHRSESNKKENHKIRPVESTGSSSLFFMGSPVDSRDVHGH